MTKTSRIFYIDSEVVELLKNEANMSLLVNNLIRQHYDLDSSAEALEKKRSELESSLEEIKSQLVLIEKKLKEAKNNKKKGYIVRYT